MTDILLKRMAPFERYWDPRLHGFIRSLNPWLPDWREFVVQNTMFHGPGAKGWARRGVLVICPTACTLAGRGYSWPGSVSDCTEFGVYLHEVGHVIHYSRPDGDALAMKLRKSGDKKITGYEPNEYETFAETFRLFFGNPDLLKTGRPRRYNLLLEAGITHPEIKPWREVLGVEAPRLRVEQCEHWIKVNDRRR